MSPALAVKKLESTVGAEVLGVESDQLLADDALPAAVMEALSENGVLVFRALHIDDETQVAFSKKLDDVGKPEPAEPPTIYRVSLDPTKTATADLLLGTLHWHIDGAQDDVPTKATLLSGHVIAPVGGETEFASTYAAYEDLSDDERRASRGCGWCTRSSRRSAGSTRTRLPSCWPAGTRSPTRSTRSCGSTGRAGAPW
jgi:alpha-ketoglutarate-dependent taurine dioxygenase